MTHVRVEHVRAPASQFHQRDLPDEPGVWVVAVTGPALVLGSTQDPAVTVDRAALDRAAPEVVRRRSGGGAVWLAPGEHAWVDVVVPAGHPRWEVDVGRAMWWVGETWLAALRDVLVEGLDPGTAVHQGGLVTTAWSRTVCFAGVGPGEVLDGAGRKLVGVSQRRTRAAARFQCAVLARWDPLPYERLLAAHPPVADLADVATGVPAAALTGLVERFVERARAVLAVGA